MPSRSAFAAAVLTALLGSCVAGEPQASTYSAAPTIDVPAPAGDVAGVAWLPSGWIVVSFVPDAQAHGTVAQLWRLRPDGTELAPVAVEDGEMCRRAVYQEPTRMPDGRLGYAKGCSGQSGAPVWSIWEMDLDAVDAPTNVGATGRQPNALSWRRDMAALWFAAGSFICHGIAALAGDEVIGLDVMVGQGADPFSLNAAYGPFPAADCRSVGWADQPTWSPEDDVAFIASTAAIGMDGQPRLDAPASIYRWSEGMAAATELLSGIVHPRSLRYSPDGSKLAFGGIVENRAGTWIFDPVDGALVRLADTEAAWLDWAPAGDELVVILPDAPAPGVRRGIVRMTVPAEVQ